MSRSCVDLTSDIAYMYTNMKKPSYSSRTSTWSCCEASFRTWQLRPIYASYGILCHILNVQFYGWTLTFTTAACDTILIASKHSHITHRLVIGTYTPDCNFKALLCVMQLRYNHLYTCSNRSRSYVFLHDTRFTYYSNDTKIYNHARHVITSLCFFMVLPWGVWIIYNLYRKYIICPRHQDVRYHVMTKQKHSRLYWV